MLSLPNGFTLHRYGIDVRLVKEEDSEFIVSLRTNERLARYLHATSDDVEAQRRWIKSYLDRFSKGEDFYFVYSHEGVPFGVNRIYNISELEATGGSWVCAPDTLPEFSIASLLVMRDIMFEFLGLDYDIFDVQMGNKQVRKLHLMLGAKKIGETDNQENFKLYKNDYIEKRESLTELLNLTR